MSKTPDTPWPCRLKALRDPRCVRKVPAPQLAVTELLIDLARSAVSGIITARAVTCPSVTCPSCLSVTLTCPSSTGIDIGFVAVLFFGLVLLITGIIIGFAVGAACCRERPASSNRAFGNGGVWGGPQTAR